MGDEGCERRLVMVPQRHYHRRPPEKKKFRSCGFPGFKTSGVHARTLDSPPIQTETTWLGAQNDAALGFRAPPPLECGHPNVHKQSDCDGAAICSTAGQTSATMGEPNRGAPFNSWRHLSAQREVRPSRQRHLRDERRPALLLLSKAPNFCARLKEKAQHRNDAAQIYIQPILPCPASGTNQQKFAKVIVIFSSVPSVLASSAIFARSHRHYFVSRISRRRIVSVGQQTVLKQRQPNQRLPQLYLARISRR